MSRILLDSLIHVLVERNADAVVIDAGQRPYTLNADGRHADFCPQPATSDQVDAILIETLTAGPRDALARLGAVEQPLSLPKHFLNEALTVTAVRMHGIAWLEIRRDRTLKRPSFVVAAVESIAQPVAAITAGPAESHPVEAPSNVPEPEERHDLTEQRREQPARRRRPQQHSKGGHRVHATSAAERPLFGGYGRRQRRSRGVSSVLGRLVHFVIPNRDRQVTGGAVAEMPRERSAHRIRTRDRNALISSFRTNPGDDLILPDASELWPDEEMPGAAAPKPVRELDDWNLGEVFPNLRDAEPVEPETSPAVLAAEPALPIDAERDTPQRIAASVPVPPLARLLVMAVTRGATTLHMASGTRPAIRVDAEIVFLDESPLSAADMDGLLEPSMPAAALKELQQTGRAEWVADVPKIGRAVGSAFYDHRGLSAIFRVSVGRAPSADDLGLPPEVQALALEPEGLIVVSGPRLSGKGDVLTAFVDLVNRLRRDYVIVLQNEIREIHESDGCLISQRKVGGGTADLLAAARMALRDDPDVLVVEDVQSDSMIRLALKAAGAGHLVVAGMPARTSTAAVEEILDAYTRDGRASAQAALSQHLCGVVTQIMLRKLGGGSMVRREVLLNTPSVAALIASGNTSQLPEAISAGRSDGMISLADTIIDLVGQRVIGLHEASRRIGNRAAFVDLLRRRGVDTSVLGPF